LNNILTDSKLAIVTLLLEPGLRREDIINRTSLSPKTIKNNLDLWRGMGIVRLDKKTKKYYIAPNQKYLNEFIVSYSNNRNRKMLKEYFNDAVIVWQWRDEFIFSIPFNIDNKNFQSAGFTRLDELKYDLIHASQYYKFDSVFEQVNKEEALVQSIFIEPKNPRAIRLLKAGLKNRDLDVNKINKYASKYEVKDLIVNEVKMSG
jgi:hypothetical protein